MAKINKKNKTFIFLLPTTTFMVVFLFFHIIPAKAQNTSLYYFNKEFFPKKNKKLPAQIDSNKGVVDWLPGQEFELFLIQKNKSLTKELPMEKTPTYLKKNLYKKISRAQSPTNNDINKKIDAKIISHNLPIALLNVWRPRVTIKIQNLSNQTWQKNTTKIISEKFNGYPSDFHDKSWLSPREVTTMQEASVEYGQTATFEFLLDGRIHPQVYDHVYYLQINGKIKHLGAKGALYWLTKIDPYIN